NERESSLGIDLDEREIFFVIAGNVMSVVSFAVIGGNLNLQIGGALDHVLVGHDVTGRVDDESRAETLQRLTDLAGPAPIVPKELRVEVVKWIANGAANDSLGIDVDHCGKYFGDGDHARLRGRISLRRSALGWPE